MLFVACRQTPQAVRPQGGGGRQVAATVVTIRTTVQPAGRTINHTLVIGETRARTTDEADTWRLYDVRTNEVIFVDDIARSYRRQSLKSLVDARRALLRRPTDRAVPRAEFVTTDVQRPIAGVSATKSEIRLGNYRRELWLAEHPSIPPQLFAMMHASDPPSTRLAAIVAAVDEALLNLRGFPLAEHAEMPYDNEKMIVDRTVVSIQKKNVPAALLEIPRGYEDVTPPPQVTAPGANRRRAS